jgi:hypothetical protein
MAEAASCRHVAAHRMLAVGEPSGRAALCGLVERRSVGVTVQDVMTLR